MTHIATMGEKENLPPFSSCLEQNETFTFACHPGVPCFTECCRQIDLPLTPYDVLRLKNHLGLSSQQFLETYVEIAENGNGVFPGLYLAMLDEKHQRCPFVGEKGCTVYANRPGPCRFYPVGRGVSRNGDNNIEEQYVLLKERHCSGFLEGRLLTVADWTADQELATYVEYNDMLTAIVQHPSVRTGNMLPDEKQQELYILALYNLDIFRQMIRQGTLPAGDLPVPSPDVSIENDEKWLRFAMAWLSSKLFP